ncbi:unnamed protein product, partial [Rotaria magnacalcarata]
MSPTPVPMPPPYVFNADSSEI